MDINGTQSNLIIHSNEPLNPTQQIICNDLRKHEDCKKKNSFAPPDYLVTENKIVRLQKKKKRKN